MLSSLGPSQVGAQIGSFHQIANTKKKCLKSHHLDHKKKTGETLAKTTKRMATTGDRKHLDVKMNLKKRWTFAYAHWPSKP